MPIDPSVPMTRDRVAELLENRGQNLTGLSIGETAGVLFLIQDHGPQGPVLLLTKRSPWVKQSGDLCCPGGRVHRVLDRALAGFFLLPGSPLSRSPGWIAGKHRGGHWRRLVSLYWSCSLRESWEEMGLRPWGVDFLGLLPRYSLALFRRGILPLVGWIRGHRRLQLNWEVERLVPIPFSALVAAENYAAYHLEADWDEPPTWGKGPVAFPCFLHRDAGGQEVLWGATYQIVLTFLDRVLGFEPPPIANRPVVTGTLSSTYATGRPRV